MQANNKSRKIKIFNNIIFLLMVLIFLCFSPKKINQDDLINEIAFTWDELRMQKDRIYTFNKNGTYSVSNIYDKDFKINGRYWLYYSPLEANKAFKDFVANGIIGDKDFFKHDEDFANIMEQFLVEGQHPDEETLHGFIMETKYSGTAHIEWFLGVWVVKNNVLEMWEGCSVADPNGIFYYKGKKRLEDGF